MIFVLLLILPSTFGIYATEWISSNNASSVELELEGWPVPRQSSVWKILNPSSASSSLSSSLASSSSSSLASSLSSALIKPSDEPKSRGKRSIWDFPLLEQFKDVYLKDVLEELKSTKTVTYIFTRDTTVFLLINVIWISLHFLLWKGQAGARSFVDPSEITAEDRIVALDHFEE
ncbi:uncharacterized protein LOC111699030 [Eurytemora carolleeae]|uniref:uncharacterized protein LOC111699030 n=1 Tax=Eurytemora carolleeae TaxID=1294199 RepID=UPI000C762F87|nr:uncharacterized protein LOC111699030 [Eurytemora carolleeae]|eukprot:XP_023325334.1 uncharacterized protein LOC111699030 [Eurytemora affinis]